MITELTTWSLLWHVILQVQNTSIRVIVANYKLGTTVDSEQYAIIIIL
jgi:uncharacterized pyridoxal phosphate-containing UPF0001 family protein